MLSIHYQVNDVHIAQDQAYILITLFVVVDSQYGIRHMSEFDQ